MVTVVGAEASPQVQVKETGVPPLEVFTKVTGVFTHQGLGKVKLTEPGQANAIDEDKSNTTIQQ